MKTYIVYILLLLQLCIYSSTIQAQVKGVVRDGRTGEPLIGANVVLVTDPTKGSVTDFDGVFEINIENFPTTINVSYIGYTALDYTISDPKDKIEIRLSEETVTIDIGVEIKGQRISDKQKAAPLTVESLDAIAIKQTASTDFYNGLGSLKGVDLTTASLGFTIINTRGFNSTSPVRSLQIIDGVDNQSPGLNFSLGNFLGAPELDIQKVDLVVGASSAFYGPNAFNGVISMETKNPFFSKGLSASVKAGERDLLETAIRYAGAVNNKEGLPFIGYKVNFSHLRAYDWVADNYDPITGSDGNRVFTSALNPGGADKVNVYGDEFFGSYASLLDARAGMNTFHRQGYKEIDLVNYNTRNTKAGLALHIRTNPSKDFDSPEIILASNFGTGTTVYQGDNRFSLRGIQFFQHRVEYRKKDKFFIRAYATHEDAGESFDPYFTALRMQEASKSNENWLNNYTQYWVRNDLGDVFDKMKALGYPTTNNEGDEERRIQWQIDNRDKLIEWHAEAQNYANQANRSNNTIDFFEPNTPRFDSIFNDLRLRLNNSQEGGTRFYDKSALYHIHGEYKIQPTWTKEIVFGANGRLFRPDTKGTIFNDSISRISNSEFGLYSGLTKELSDFTLSATARIDKNQNFNYLFSPAASVVWKPSDNNYLRVSFSSAIRNPTLSDQYLSLRVGPAQLEGNLSGYQNLITLESFNAWRNDVTNPLVYRDIDPIQPEKVRTMEIGYRTTLFERLYLDASAYYNIYRDFIGFQIGMELPFFEIELFPGGPTTNVPDFNNIRVLRVAANSDEVVNTQGFALGYNYYFKRYYSFNGNYSYNHLITQVTDNIVPAFNTPKHKYNVGLSGRDIPFYRSISFGFNVNYKWVQGFIFEGSPQFTGFIPDYDLVDAQVNFTFPRQNLTLKMGASNALNNLQFQTYGGPRIGRMAYISLTYEFKSKI